MAGALREAFAGRAEVLTPDLPLHPGEALARIHSIIDAEQPDLLIGNSCGAFLAQMVAPVAGVPALLGNPHLQMTEFLKPRMGTQQYKAPRADGNQCLVINQALIDEFAELQEHQFDFCSEYYRRRVWGIFGESDTLAHFEPLFSRYYDRAFRFPGAHTPTVEEVNRYYVPLAKEMFEVCPVSKERYFRHFKGGLYRYVGTAFDSETCCRMVVYQALYGEHAYWVRPETMFFEKLTRCGKTFNRFTEIDKE